MKTTGICPKCDCHKTFRIETVQQTYCDAGGTFRNFDITGARVVTGEKGVFGGDKTSLETAGPMGAIVCAACGYTEWYASPQALARLAQIAAGSAGVVTVSEAKARGGAPFR